MIAALKKLFSAPETTSIQDPEQAIQLASVALMIETAKSDHDLADAELNAVIELAESAFNIPKEKLDTLVSLAHEQANEATSLYEFTRLINEHYSPEQKFQVILAMWQVAYVDGRIDRYEEHIIRRVADLIYVEHVRFIEAKLTAESRSQ